MATTKKNTAPKDDAPRINFGIRLNTDERARLAEVAGLFPFLTDTSVARIALMQGLDLLEKNGIPVAKR